MIKKEHVLFVLVFLISISLTNIAYGASRVGYYTLTMPAETAVTMGDSSVTLPITVNNLSSSTDSIGYVRLDFNANVYYISYSNTAPSGWTVSEIKNAGVGQTYIVFTTTTNNIAPGNSQTFNVILTGSNNGNIPAAASDQTDAIVDDTNSTVITISEAKSNYFDRNTTGNSDNWQRKALYSSITATPSAVGSGSTITIILTVTNRSSGTLYNVQPNNSSLAINATGTASATLTSGPTPASISSLASGVSTTFQWTYTASGSGSLQFCSFAKNGTGSATSKTVCSNYVAVGDFTATLSLSSSQVVSGQSITVTMTVTNKGSTNINNINPPSPLNFQVLSGSVSSSCTGPNPGTIGNLAPGASSTFEWNCTITSTQIGSTFRYYGYASSGAMNSQPTPAYSNTGTISSYSVTVSPNTIYKGNTNVTFTFRVTNGSGATPVFKVNISTPDTGFVYVYSTASGGCTTSWTVSTAGSPTQITFSTASGCTCGSIASCIPCSGGACDFAVTYSPLPNVSINTDYNFRVDVWDTPLWKPGDPPRASIGVIVKVTVNGIVVEAIPASISPNCTTEVIATVTPTPTDGAEVDFQSTNGTWQDITETKSGEAFATLRAPMPYNAAIPNATITVRYQDASASITVTFPNTATCTGTQKRIRWREVVQ